ncbi:adenosylmethionine decarboxylase [Metaclostridioides mangenotii]|uniref:adenosylmethionine decarboxylase n=1 Tax=Metaclostridioides mangenotii TaxID=1540 RepID=UPI0004811F0B|nr:adenosylmethionine decarboxylase [Clostridioides mangenotii]
MNTLEGIRKDIGLSQSIECLEKGLVYLFLNKTIATKELAKKMEVPVPIATAFKKELVKHGFLKRESFYFMTLQGKKYVTQHLMYQGIDIDFYKTILNCDEAMDSFLYNISGSLQEYYANRPLAKVEIDQAHATIETSIKRVGLLLKDPLIFSKTVAFMGDDDLTSLLLAQALSNLGYTNSGSIYVFDIDRELLEFIALSNRCSVKINIRYQDFREETKDSNFSADIIVTDPPYTPAGLLAFIIKSHEIIRENGMIYISFSHKTPQIQRYLQDKINELGYNFLEIKPNFNKYVGGSVIGNVSNLYILQRVSISKSSLYSKNDIYTQDSKRGKQSQRLGFHSLYELRDCNEMMISNVKNVKEAMYTVVDKFKLNVVTDNFHQFSPYGVSGVIVLKESHFTVHTWPECNYAAIDLFVCEDTINEKQVMDTLRMLFHSKRHAYTTLYRES